MGSALVYMLPEVEKGAPSREKRQIEFLHKTRNKYPKTHQYIPNGGMRKGFSGTNNTAGGTREDTIGVLTWKWGMVS